MAFPITPFFYVPERRPFFNVLERRHGAFSCSDLATCTPPGRSPAAKRLQLSLTLAREPRDLLKMSHRPPTLPKRQRSWAHNPKRLTEPPASTGVVTSRCDGIRSLPAAETLHQRLHSDTSALNSRNTVKREGWKNRKARTTLPHRRSQMTNSSLPLNSTLSPWEISYYSHRDSR